GFRCVSHEDDPLLYKVTPLMMARISLHSHTKRLSPSPIGEVTVPRWCSARHIFVCALRRRGYGLIGHSCRSANFAKTALQTGGCASIKSRDKMTHRFVCLIDSIPHPANSLDAIITCITYFDPHPAKNLD